MILWKGLTSHDISIFQTLCNFLISAIINDKDRIDVK